MYALREMGGCKHGVSHARRQGSKVRKLRIGVVSEFGASLPKGPSRLRALGIARRLPGP